MSDRRATRCADCGNSVTARRSFVGENASDLAALMFHAERFCSYIEVAALERGVPPADSDELRLKLGQCRNGLARLQSLFNEDKLSIDDASVRAEFRLVLLTLLWTVYYGRTVLDRKPFRHLLLVHAGFSDLLARRG